MESQRTAAETFFVVGPVAFIALSFVLSVPLAKRLARRFGRPRHAGETFWERPALGARALSLLAALGLLWGVATGVGRVLLALPDPRGPADRVRFDAALVAHAVPPLSKLAAARIANELREARDVTRFRPAGEIERRFVAAARVDPDAARAVEELARRGLRTHAGRFALASASLAPCDAGLDALAEALQGSALQDLMLRCRNAPGDAIGRAAFKMGDFSRGVGPETESIISRQPRSPILEPSCFAGGLEVPPESEPLCRLIHAEMVPKTRAVIHAKPILEPAFARRWLETARLAPGQSPPATVRFTIDPELLVRRPRAALRDEPTAIQLELVRRGTSALDPIAAAWLRLAVAAASSEAGDRAAAREDLATARVDLGRAADDDERARARRLALAIAIRVDDDDAIADLVADLPDDDALSARARWTIDPRATDSAPRWVQLVAAGAPGAEVADALAGEEAIPDDLGRLAAVPSSERAPLREWLREGFPACGGCTFAERLDLLTLRLDGARALGDDDLADALDDVFARYQAVVTHRLLALSLRASSP